MSTVHVSNQNTPEWRVVAEQEHLILLRQFPEGGKAFAVLTGCGLIATPSPRDTRLNAEGYDGKVPRCRLCELREPELLAHPHTARTS